VIAVLEAARRITNPAVGVLLTGAEEFGLVGARILASTRAELIAGTEIVNIDTVDERGALAIVSHDARGHSLAARLAPGLRSDVWTIRERRLPLGIFVDSWPLARAGASAVTVARLDWRTLRLIHTPRDTMDGLSLETARAVGAAVARWAG
jgi:Zn-dependent M28 family amino/carboxypeptidase